MKKLRLSLVALCAMTAIAQAQVYSPTVGFNTITCKAGSDTYISVGFNQTPTFAGAVSTIPAANQIQIAGTPAFTVGGFTNTHFVKILTGAKAGAYLTITGNTADTLSLDLSANSLTGVVAGDTLQVIPYWTLGTLFPIGSTAIVQSAGTSNLQRRTQVLVPNLTGLGVNLAATGVYFQTSTGWKDSLNGNAAADNIPIVPDVFLIIRNHANFGDTQFVAQGVVDGGSSVSELTTTTADPQDNAVANNRPIDIALKDLDLISSGAFVGSNGTGGLARRDLLLTFDNTQVGTNKAANHIYYYDTQTSNWKDASTSNRISDDDVIAAGTGFIIRKFRSDGATKFWSHDLVNN